MISSEEYRFIADLVQQKSGIELGPDKLYLIESRIQSVLAEFKLDTITQLVERLKDGARNSHVLRAVVDSMTTNETLFFRDRVPFEVLTKKLVPYFQQVRKASRRLRIWSAGCAGGQEPYSLLMTLATLPEMFKSWKIEVLATDLCSTVLEKAKLGIYTQFEIRRGVSGECLARYFVPTDSRWQIADFIREKVVFRELNLIDPLPVMEPFDIVLCRNVLIYFSHETKKKVLESIATAMSPDGFLILGGAESAINITDSLIQVPGVGLPLYKRAVLKL
jgi:chemotaxis protein methyltransferase CheR